MIFSISKICFSSHNIIMLLIFIIGYNTISFGPQAGDNLIIIFRQEQFQLFGSLFVFAFLHRFRHLSQSIFRVVLFIEFPYELVINRSPKIGTIQTWNKNVFCQNEVNCIFMSMVNKKCKWGIIFNRYLLKYFLIYLPSSW